MQNLLPQLATAQAQGNKQKQDELEPRVSEMKQRAGLQIYEQEPKAVSKLVEGSITRNQRQELRAINSEINGRLNSSGERKAAQDFKTWMSAGAS